MMNHRSEKLLLYLILAFVGATSTQAQDGMDKSLLRKFDLKESGLALERRTQPGTFFDVVGHNRLRWDMKTERSRPGSTLSRSWTTSSASSQLKVIHCPFAGEISQY